MIDDPDETAGRRLYRARADTLANAHVNYERRKVTMKTTTDIVERLRKRVHGKQLGDDPLSKVLGEAADEIERLRAQIIDLEGELDRLMVKFDQLKELH